MITISEVIGEYAICTMYDTVNVLYYVRREILPEMIKKIMDGESSCHALQMSDYVVSSGQLTKSRFPVKDLLEKSFKQPPKPPEVESEYVRLGWTTQLEISTAEMVGCSMNVWPNQHDKTIPVYTKRST